MKKLIVILLACAIGYYCWVYFQEGMDKMNQAKDQINQQAIQHNEQTLKDIEAARR